MAICNSFPFLLLLLSTFLSFASPLPKTKNTLNPKTSTNPSQYHSSPLTSLPLSHSSSLLLHSLSSTTSKTPNPSDLSLKSSFKYTMALVISLRVGTPPQTQQMVLDTGSQLSWIQCKTTIQPPSFDPTHSSSFSILPCNTSLCKPPIPDFTLPTFCDQNRRCRYSYFYADGTVAEGNLAREIIAFERTGGSQIIGCASSADSQTPGLLGLNLGRLSYTSQAKISKFSYCIPDRKLTPNSPGTFYLGENPNSGRLKFTYANLIKLPRTENRPYFDRAAFTIDMEGIEVGGKRLNVSRSVFLPDAAGAGQTMVDSGTEFTFLVGEAYAKLKQEFDAQVGFKAKQGFVYQEAFDLCYDLAVVREKWPEVVLVLGGGGRVTVPQDRVVAPVSNGVGCLSFGNSDLLGVESNIIGNYHQQNMWVEYDVSNSRVGFAPADCSRAR